MRACKLALAVIVGILATGASSSAQAAKTAAIAAASKKALEERFLKLQETSTVKLVRVSSTTANTVLAIELRPPTPEKFEFHAETAMTLAWQALFKVPGAFEHIARIQLTLSNARTMAIDCPIKTVRESYGYFDFAGIKKGCTVR